MKKTAPIRAAFCCYWPKPCEGLPAGKRAHMTYRGFVTFTTPFSAPASFSLAAASVLTPFDFVADIFGAPQPLKAGSPVAPRTTLLKRGRKRTWKTPELKVALLGAILDERAKWKAQRRASDSELLCRLQKRGLFTRWKHATLKVELSRAWCWFRSKRSELWFENNSRNVDITMAAVCDEPVLDLI